MKTYLFGVISGLLLALAWKHRATLIPWLRTEEQKIVDRLAKKESK